MPEPSPAHRPVFDLGAIGAALQELSAQWAAGKSFGAGASGDPEEVARHMLEGYAYVDGLLARDLDPFVYGGSRLLLEMNHQVLCGAGTRRRAEFARHLAATERRFYDDHQCGADAFYAMVARSRHLKPIPFAARIYRQIVEAPQLFIEGNQRTATLVASFVLGRAGLPPMVPTAKTFGALSVLSATCKAMDRRWFLSMAWGWMLDLQMQNFIMRTAQADFLADKAALPPPSVPPAATSSATGAPGQASASQRSPGHPWANNSQARKTPAHKTWTGRSRADHAFTDNTWGRGAPAG